MSDRSAGIVLKFKEAQPRHSPRKRTTAKGTVAEFFAIPEMSVEYDWSGDTHYLGLHDIDLRDGETLLDGVPKSTLHDLRNRLTFVPAGATVSGWSIPRKRSNNFTALYFNHHELGAELQESYASVDLAPSLYFEHPVLASTMVKLTQLLQASLAGSRLHTETLGLLAALELVQWQKGIARKPLAPKGGLTLRHEKMVVEYIDDRLGKELSLTELAKLAGLTRFHFARSFKTSTGLPPHQFVLSRRIERARALLLTTSDDLGLIASKVGFANASQLARTFRKFTGVSAGTFRKQSR